MENNMKENVVSLIIPIYNQEKYLAECIESVINQDYKNIEIILVNDGSSDSSIDICRKYQEIDSRITIAEKENGGLSSARNYGLELASGEYISFVDSDDFISPTYVSNLYKAMTSTDSDISMCGYIKFSKKEDINFIQNVQIEEFSPRDALKKILYQKNQTYFSVSVCNKLFRRYIFDNIRFPEGKTYEDVAIITDLIEKSKKVSCIYSCDYYYRINPMSITNIKFSKKNMDVIYFTERIIDYFKDDYEFQMAAISMFFRRNIEMLSKYYVAKYNDNEIKNILKTNIKKYRKKILFDRNSKMSSKISAFISYFSIKFVVIMRNLLKNS